MKKASFFQNHSFGSYDWCKQRYKYRGDLIRWLLLVWASLRIILLRLLTVYAIAHSSILYSSRF